MNFNFKTLAQYNIGNPKEIITQKDLGDTPIPRSPIP